MPDPRLSPYTLSSAPTGHDADGRPFWSLRCRIPFAFDARAAGSWQVRDAHRAEGATERIIEQAAPAPVENPNMPKVVGPQVVGYSSSTGVDAYGTEMSQEALASMADQCKRGTVVYLPTHPGLGCSGEWEDVIGYLVDGEVEAADVPSAASAEEAGFRLRTVVQLDETNPKAMMLADKLKAGHPIGQSIGGYFTRMRFQFAEGQSPDDWMSVPERIIVEDVELDHVAATRMPANRESYIAEVRSMLTATARSVRSTSSEDAPKAETPVQETPVQEKRGAMDAPAYRPSNTAERCGRCVHFVADEAYAGTAGQCKAFSFLTVATNVCDGWQENPEVPSATPDEMLSTEQQMGKKVEVEVEIGGEYEPKEGEMPPEGEMPSEEPTVEEVEEVKEMAEVRAVVPFQDHPLAPLDTEWSWDADAGNEVLGDPPDWKRYESVHVYMDPEKAETREGYKLPIAKVIEGRIHAVFSAVVAALGALNGARGGVDIPADERQAAYDHLVKYYEKAGKEPPALMEMGAGYYEMPEKGMEGEAGEKPAALSSQPQLDTNVPTRDSRAIGHDVLRGAPYHSEENQPMSNAEQRIAELEARIAALAGEPQRRGIVHHLSTGPAAESEIDALVRTASGDTRATALVAICRSRGFSERRMSDDVVKVTKSHLETDLRALLNAAEADGLLGSADAGWR